MMGWNLGCLNLDCCWQHGFTGAGVKVGHLDTGIDGAHPALCDRITTFAQFDENGEILPNTLPHDSSDHGTHTAGIICGGTVDGQAIGIAPDAKLCSGMVIEGRKPLIRVLCGLDWMFDQRVRVVCVSLGMPGYNPLFETVLARLRQQEVLCIVPIGNSGRRSSYSPANYPGVLAVGAVDQNNRVANFSSSQVFDRPNDPIKPNLVAPGVDILSTKPGGGLSKQSGTSMAAAHVAGVAALLFQAKPDATVDEIEHALLKSCILLPDVDPQRMGCGLVNPVGALETLLASKETALGVCNALS
ncbi:S8 family serine peptidase [Oscillatoria sp. FACHB-1407]|uniref:S8 family peptidase n=1 Tax=Oscillatoria sp. FACHB-1407 TaxID=2692847 RepID=UPI00168637BA|nr:S8 family serine peptidase [Oscillatoria sp. FACHB-1407]MBD2464232.1 S8 family serine peptidase [Oscillatoria sp. FACHB-1407]